MRHIATRLGVACLLFSFGITPAAASTIYLDKAAFVAGAGPLTIESLATLAASAIAASVDVDGFTISPVTPALQVRNAPLAGLMATLGSTYVRWDSTTVGFVRIVFDTSIERFGLTVTDVFDAAGTLIFTMRRRYDLYAYGEWGIAALLLLE